MNAMDIFINFAPDLHLDKQQERCLIKSRYNDSEA